MKVKVVERFNDKNTKEFYKIDQVIEVTKERFQEIKKYVEPIEETKQKNSNKQEG